MSEKENSLKTRVMFRDKLLSLDPSAGPFLTGLTKYDALGIFDYKGLDNGFYHVAYVTSHDLKSNGHTTLKISAVRLESQNNNIALEPDSDSAPNKFKNYLTLQGTGDSSRVYDLSSIAYWNSKRTGDEVFFANEKYVISLKEYLYNEIHKFGNLNIALTKL